MAVGSPRSRWAGSICSSCRSTRRPSSWRSSSPGEDTRIGGCCHTWSHGPTARRDGASTVAALKTPAVPCVRRFLGGGAGSRGAAAFEAMRAELGRTHPGCKFHASVAEVAARARPRPSRSPAPGHRSPGPGPGPDPTLTLTLGGGAARRRSGARTGGGAHVRRAVDLRRAVREGRDAHLPREARRRLRPLTRTRTRSLTHPNPEPEPEPSPNPNPNPNPDPDPNPDPNPSQAPTARRVSRRCASRRRSAAWPCSSATTRTSRST